MQFLHFASRACHLFLDTHLYNAHTVAAEVLQGGLPLFTLPGRTMASRVASSFLQSLGCCHQDELCARSGSDYVQKAVDLSRNSLDLLSRLRKRILDHVHEGSSLLFNPRDFAKVFSDGLHAIWQRYKRGEEPEHLYINGTVGVTSAQHTHMHSEL